MADLSSYINVAANGITTINNITPSAGASPTPNIDGFSNISATGNITGAYLAGNGVQITGITSTGTLTSLSVTGTSTLGNIESTGTFSVTGTSTLGNIESTGTLSVTGTSTLGNIESAGTLSVTGNITTDGLITATGNISGGNLATTGTLSVGGNAQTGNLTVTSLDSSGTGSFGANVNMNGNWLNNIGYAVTNTDAASKQYVDTMVSTGITYHQPVTVATTTTTAVATGGTTSYNEPGGAGDGVGAYISTTGVFEFIDSSNVQTVGTRILVKNEANAAWNGIYTYANTTAIVRSTDADQYGTNSTTRLSINNYFFVQDGTVNNGSSFIVSSPTGTITFGTSNITFTVFSSSQTYTGGTGITVSGTTISANASQTQVTAVGNLTTLNVLGNANVGILSAVGYGVFSNLSTTGSGGDINGANLISANAFSATGSITGGNLNTGGAISAAGQILGGNLVTGGLVTSIGNVSGGNLTTGGVVSATGNITGNFFIGNGSQLTGLNTSGISNGNSNVNIATSNGDVTINSAGNATMTVTGTGVTVAKLTSFGNITLSSTGNYAYGLTTVLPTATASSNLVWAQMASNDYFRIKVGGTGDNQGFVEFATADDGTEPIYVRQYTGLFVTAVNSATLLDSQGNTTFPGSITAGRFISATGNITGGNITTGGLVTSTGNVRGGNLTTGGLVSATGNITGTQLISTVTTGTAPLVVSSTTSVANLTAGRATTVIDGKLGTAMTFSYEGIQGGEPTWLWGTDDGITSKVYRPGNLSANTANTASVVTTNAQPNITSVGTLTVLSVSGNATIGNLSVTGNLNYGSSVIDSLSVTGNANIGGNLNVSGTSSNVIRRAYGAVPYNTTVTLDTLTVGVAQFTGSNQTANCLYVQNPSTNFSYTSENMIAPASTVSLLQGVITAPITYATLSQAMVSGGDMARVTIATYDTPAKMYRVTVLLSGSTNKWNISIERLT